MIKPTIQRLLLLSIVMVGIVAFLKSCAIMVMPEGGPRDEEPPKLVRSFPKNYSTHFNRKEILLEFDEFVVLSNVTQELIVSPPLDKTPDIYVKKGRTVVIELEEELDSNTTYTFNFGDAIQDLTENNPLSAFSFVVSTGDYVDSLSVMGYAYDAKSLKPEEGLKIFLHRNLEDSAAFTTKPIYYTKAKEDGRFALLNLKEGIYRLYATTDDDNNFKVNNGENFAFYPQEILVDKDSIQLSEPLRLSTYYEKPPRPSKATRAENGLMKLTFDRTPDSLEISPFLHTFDYESSFKKWSEERDTFYYWYPPNEADSLDWLVKTRQHPLGDFRTDTVQIKKPRKKQTKGKTSEQPETLETEKTEATDSVPKVKEQKSYRMQSPMKNKQTLPPNQKIIFTFNHPIVEYLPKAPIIVKDSVEEKLSDTALELKSPFEAVLHYAFEEDIKYQLFIPDSMFFDLKGNYNDSIRMHFALGKVEEYGLLEITFTSNKRVISPFIVELLNEKGEAVRTHFMEEPKRIRYEHLKPDEYRIRITTDEINNLKWDPHYFPEKFQAEKVYLHNEVFKVRANWDLMDIKVPLDREMNFEHFQEIKDLIKK